VGNEKLPGREILVRSPDPKWWFRAQVLSVGDRLYMVAVAGPEKAATENKQINTSPLSY
jgi:hypothetical protein